MGNVSEGKFLIKVEGITGYFTTLTGGQTTVANSKVFNGGDEYAAVVTGNKEVENITVSRPYKPERDAQYLVDLRARIPGFKSNVSKQPLDEGGFSIGKPTVYPAAELIRVTDPDANWSSGNPAMMELEFAVTTVV